MTLGQFVSCAVCLLAGVAIGHFARSRMKMPVVELVRQHDRLGADEVRRLGELMERKWGVSALPFSPAAEKEDDS